MTEHYEWKQVRLHDLLTDEQVEEVYNYLKRPDATTQGLISILKKWEEQLKAKGVLPEYLGYYLWYATKLKEVL